MDNRPIGVFDSGVGGLTVVKEIMKQLPSESIVYFGDTARVPYGTKSAATVTKYSMQDIRFLLTHDIKAIVIACNTASALSLDAVKNEFDIPIIGVVRPGAISAVAGTVNKKVGIIGTQATISSKAYEKCIKSMDNEIETFNMACSLFVPLVEEGWFDNEIAYKIAQEYLGTLKDKDIDTLILGCTHYPLLMKIIGKIIGEKVKLINPAFETAKQLKEMLSEKGMLRDQSREPEYNYYLSDVGTKFSKIANYCLGKRTDNIEKVDIERF